MSSTMGPRDDGIAIAIGLVPIPPLRRRTISSARTVIPPPISAAMHTVPPATSGHITSITLMPVSRTLPAPVGVLDRPESSATIRPISSRLTGVSL
jgi:hypothetical protein